MYFFFYIVLCLSQFYVKVTPFNLFLQSLISALLYLIWHMILIFNILMLFFYFGLQLFYAVFSFSTYKIKLRQLPFNFWQYMELYFWHVCISTSCFNSDSVFPVQIYKLACGILLHIKFWHNQTRWNEHPVQNIC